MELVVGDGVSRTSGGRPYDALQYPWLLTADPPVCRIGPALAVLSRCERQRRGESCFCRFEAGDIAEALEAAGAADLAEYLATALEPEDVEELARRLGERRWELPEDSDLADKIAQFGRDIDRLVRHGSGLTDRYSDDLD